MNDATASVMQQDSKHLVGSLGETDSSFRLLVASVLDYAIVMLDPMGRVVSWNAGAEHLKGYKAEEILGQNFSKFYPQKDVEAGKPAKELEIATREGRFEDLGQRIRKDGTLFWANVVITALRNETGELLGFGKVTRDLTERQRAEAALRESEETLRLIIESFKDTAIFMLDVQGRVLSWNVGAERIKGYKANEIIGQNFSIFYSKEDRASKQPERELEIASKTGRFEDEGWRVKKDGSHFRASVIIFAIRDSSGKLKGYSKLINNITERRHLQKLEEVQRATFNILEDFSNEKDRLEKTQHATFNILDDFSKEQEKLEHLQKAAFNILEDLNGEKEKLEIEVNER
ncbi:MAG: PAS domain-containing protein, partial [Bdellovibrionota bacterium]